jgi:quinol monooxygenase YgiN
VLIIAGYLIMDPLDRAQFVDAHLDLVNRARAASGCLDLAISPDPVDARRVNNYEAWDSEDSLNAWRLVAAAPHLDIKFTDGEMSKYLVETTAPVFG